MWRMAQSHQKAIAAGQLKKERKYWLNKLSGELVKTGFPSDFKAISSEKRQEKISFQLTGVIFSRLMKLRNNSDHRLHMILVSALMVLLHRYTGINDIILGSPTIKQDREVEFINTVLILRNVIHPGMTFKELLLQVRQTIIEATENQDYPVETLPDQLNMPVSGEDDFPLLDIAILLENIHDKRYIMHINPRIIFSFCRTNEKITGELEYNASLYSKHTIEKIIVHYRNLLTGVVSNIDEKLAVVEILSEEEKHQLLVEFNAAKHDFPGDKTIHCLFEEQVEKTPQRTAVVFENQQITYAALNEKAQRLARHLNAEGVRTETIAAVMIERSMEMIIGILGILKSGSAYLPVSPDYPGKHINHMLMDSDTKLILTQNKFVDKIKASLEIEIEIIDLEAKENYRESPINLTHTNGPQNLAYVIYTSGSTGKPKGVMIGHCSVVNRLHWMQKKYPLNENDRIIQKTPFFFDVSVWELFWWSMVGASVCFLFPGFERIPQAIVETVETRHITTMHFVPSMMSAFLGYMENSGEVHRLSNLKQVFCSGETLKPAHVERFNKTLYQQNGTQLVNLYGPTEATVDVSYFDCPTDTYGTKIQCIPIGKPIDNIQLYVMDEDFREQPVGVAGELCIGGVGLARGYLNRPVLTADKFVGVIISHSSFVIRSPSKLSTNDRCPKTNERLYLTGDRARWLEDGNIEFLGRMDFQVKIRGLRIELGEIENRLQEHHKIKEAVVMTKESDPHDGNKLLWAYITTHEKLNLAETREYCSTRLPDYMIPSYFVELEQMPRTGTGKIDRKKLLQLERPVNIKEEYLPPRNQTEEIMVELWKNMLHLDKVGITDNFFNIGGDSIKAISLLNIINKEFDTDFKAAVLSQNETVEKIVGMIDSTRKVSHDRIYQEVRSEIEALKNTRLKSTPIPGNIEDIFPLSDIEKGMIFYSLKDMNLPVYHNQMVYQVTDKSFDPEVFNQALALMVDKHYILRTAYSMYGDDGEEPVHLVYKRISPDVEHRDISHMDRARQEEYIRVLLQEDLENPFDFNGEKPLWRMKTLSLDNENICFIWIFHHAIIDGWSLASLLTELNNTYWEMKKNRNFVPVRLKSSYKDFVIEQIIQGKRSDVCDYWKRELEGYKRFEFPGDGIGHDSHDTPAEIRRMECDLGEQLLQKLKEVAVKYKTSVKALCFAAYVYMLNMQSYENDMVVGLITNNRAVCEDGEKIIGCFLNTVPVRLKLSTPGRWIDYINLIDSKLKELKKYDILSLYRIVEMLEEEVGDRNPVTDTIFNYTDFYIYSYLNRGEGGEEALDHADSRLSVEGYGATNTLFDFSIDTTRGGFWLLISYFSSVVSREEVERLCSYFKKILDKLIHEPGSLVKKEELISWPEKQKLLYEFNDTGFPHPAGQTLCQLFERQAARTPDRIAVLGPVQGKSPNVPYEKRNQEVTYNELNRQSHQLAHVLRERGVLADGIVGIMAERSIEMIIGVFGILKAGGAYLPIDPDYPEERINYMLKDAKVNILVKYSNIFSKMRNGKELLILDFEHLNFEYVSYFTFGISNLNAANLSYVIYTSGSGGEPKGVLVEHSSVVNLVFSRVRCFNINENDRVLQFSSICFDASVEQIFIALSSGAVLVLIDKDTLLDINKFQGFIVKQSITHLNAVPSFLNRISLKRKDTYALRRIISGGDICPPALAKRWSVYCDFYNAYGPTETSITSLVKKFERGEVDEALSGLPVGRPIHNTVVYVFDKGMNLVPLGAPGELYIGGKGAARGYLNNPELTAEKFGHDLWDYQDYHDEKFLRGGAGGAVFSKSVPPGRRRQKIYRTGDLVRWLPEGNLEFVGRVDFQVKIQGMRVEPQEIENRLTRHPAVKEAVVIASAAAGETFLCAYYVEETVEEREEPEIRPSIGEYSLVDADRLREYLSGTLPAHMIPTFFIKLEKVPLTSHGKTDIKALPHPELMGKSDYAAPRDEIEEKLLEIWTNVLKVNRIGINDNFFQLGGQSLKAAAVAARVHRELQVRLPLKEIFKYPNILTLAQYIKGAKIEKFLSIKPVEKKQFYPLSSAQRRLFFLQEMDPDSTGYNIPFAAVLEGKIHIPRLEGVFKSLVKRHESLRTSFRLLENEPVQRVHDQVEFEIEYYDVQVTGALTHGDRCRWENEGTRGLAPLSKEPAAALINFFIRPFDLSLAPLLRVRLIAPPHTAAALRGHPCQEGKKNQYILMVDMHHIISDGISYQILVKDFMTLYANGELSPLRLQYKDYSQWQNSPAERERLKQQQIFWLKEFQGEIPETNVPFDYPIPGKERFAGSTITFEMEEKETHAIKAIGRRTGTTLYMVLLALYNILLSRVFNREDIVVGVPTAGRRHADLEQIMGMFVNMLPLRSFLPGEKYVSQFLAEVKQRTLQVFENQDYPFEELVAHLQVKRETNRNPLFNTGFGMFTADSQPGEVQALKTTTGLELIPYPFENNISKIDLTLNSIEQDGKVFFTFEYSTNLFKEETIRNFAGYFKEIIAAVVGSSDNEIILKLKEINILSEEQREKLLYDFNATAVEYPGDKTIHALFEEQVEQTPNQVALRCTVDSSYFYEPSGNREVGQYEGFCFRKNPYVFQYQNSDFLDKIIDKNETHQFILLRTHKGNYTAVNPSLFSLLDYFDETTNLKSIMNGLVDQKARFLVFNGTRNDEGEPLTFKRYAFEITPSFNDLLPLIKMLVQVNLVVPAGYHLQSIPLDIHLNDRGKSRKRVKGTNEKKRRGPGAVLLLGDTPGPASTGLLYLAAYLRRHGIEAYCHWNDTCSGTRRLTENIETLLSQIRPKIVGISMKWFPHIARVFEIAKIVKTRDASIKVIVGGNTASYYSEQVIQNQWVDCVIRGDGEVPLLRMCKGEDDVPNAIYKKNGKIISNPIGYIQDKTNSADIFLSHLDEIFVPAPNPYLASAFYINTGKGCSQQCFYCAGCREAQKRTFNRSKPFLRDVREVRKDLQAVIPYTSTLMFDFDLPFYHSNSIDYYRQIWEGIDLSNHFCWFYSWELPSPELMELVTTSFNYVYFHIDLCSLSESHRMKLGELGVVKPQPTDKELFKFLDSCESYENLDIVINQVAGLPYFTAEDIKKSHETLSRIITGYTNFKGIDWGRLHAQPGAPISSSSETYDMHSYAATFQDFLDYSQRNLREQDYPGIKTLHYPYIYFNDEDLNSMISRFYFETEKQLTQIPGDRRNQRVFTDDISYKELNRQADRLAGELRVLGVAADTIVAIAAKPSTRMAVAILGILKAGGAYLPIDPEYPEARIKYMLADSSAKFLVTTSNVVEDRKIGKWEDGKNLEIVLLDYFSPPPAYPSTIPFSHQHLQPAPSASVSSSSTLTSQVSTVNLAYIIYTSGTTGWSKGTLIQHSSAVNTLLYRKKEYQMSGKDVALQLFSFAFDGFVTSFFTPLISGSQVILMGEQEKKDIACIKDAVVKHRVTHFICVPSFYRIIIENLSPVETSSLQVITLAGDKVTGNLVEMTKRKNRNLEMVNEYGVTEAAVMSTIYRHQQSDSLVKIGRPIGNTRIYIMNSYFQLLPIGIAGELCISGAGLARGYLNNPGLTAEKFDHDLLDYRDYHDGYHRSSRSYTSYISKKIYKTGDLARWLTDGNIEFLGRIDHQVKIRGFRIQLREIENCLLKHPGIKEAVVTAREDEGEDNYLCAYIVANAGPGGMFAAKPNDEELREYLSQTLPHYMVPSYLVPMDKFPVTSNGKLDIKALPMPGTAVEGTYAAAENPVQEKLVETWAHVLGLEKNRISIDADFFALGGHSLKAITVVTKIHHLLKVKLPLTEFFNAPTIRKLSAIIAGTTKKQYVPIEPTEKKDYYVLSSAQKRLYILQQMELNNTVYNIPQFALLEGRVDRIRLQDIFNRLIQRHENLRTSFHMVKEEPVQRIHDQVEFEIKYFLATEGTEEARKIGSKEDRKIGKVELLGQINAWDELPPDKTRTHHSSFIIHHFICSFDLSQPPLMRVGLIRTNNREHILMVDIHHIAADGVSYALLMTDFMALYGNPTGELPAIAIQYKDYAQWQDQGQQKEAVKKQETYWLKQLSGDIPVLDLPGDYPRPAIQSFAGDVVTFEIGRQETRALNRLVSQHAGITLFMMLVSIFDILLSKLSNQEDILVGTPISGRRHVNLEQVMGMFVNMLVLRNRPVGQLTFNDFLNQVKETTIQAFENQEYPFEELVEHGDLDIKRDPGRNPLFDAAFTFQTIDIPELQVPGLKLKPYESEDLFHTSKFDITLRCQEISEKLYFDFEYCTTLFKEETILRFTAYFKTIVSSVIKDPGRKIGKIEPVPAEEKEWILVNLNNTSASYSAAKTIHRLFEEQVERTPDHTALIGQIPNQREPFGKINAWGEAGLKAKSQELRAVTYSELNERSNQLARLLLQKGIIPDTIAAIIVQRTIEMVIGLLGILKAGAAYLPIDPDYPESRVGYMLEDSRAPVLLTTGSAVKGKCFTRLQQQGLVEMRTCMTGFRPQVKDLDGLLLPDRSLVNYERYHRHIGQAMVKASMSLQCSRGCPYKCAYCHKIWPKHQVKRSAEHIFSEVQLYYNMGVRQFAIIDDIFNLNQRNSRYFFQLIIEKGLDVRLFFPNGVRGDLLTRDYIDLMVQAGTCGLALALETASPRLQKWIGKNLNLEKLRHNLEYICEKYPQVILELFIMHGFPTETREEALLTLDFVKSIKWLHFPYFHILKIYPHTDMEKLALESGISAEAISRSEGLAYHQLPETLPFDKNFTLKCQADFFNNYFLSKERLLHVMPYQMQILSEDELVQKYNSYLPVQISCFDDLMEYTGISPDKLGEVDFPAADFASPPDLNEKLRRHFPVKEPYPNAFRVLLLDLSQFFSSESPILYDVVEAPLGLLYIMTYLNRQFGQRIHGKIAKSRVDFDNYQQLKTILAEFSPGIIGIRTLTYYKEFFHKTTALIRQWGIGVPIIAGGPYATSDYTRILQDSNVDVVVLGEGEVTFAELVGKIIENGGNVPGGKVLNQIPGLAYVSLKPGFARSPGREFVFLDEPDNVSALPRGPVTPLPSAGSPSDLAYIIYTSGTTGNPRGVMIGHKNVVQLMVNDQFQFDFTPRDVWTLFHSFCFDFSVWEMYGALLYGGKLIIIPNMTARDTSKYLEILKEQGVTVLNQTPSAFYNLLELELKECSNHSSLRLRYVIFGGEELRPAKLKEWQVKYPGTKLVNMYGITETTVHVTYKQIEKKDIQRPVSNIGCSLPGLTVYVLDKYLNLVPIGVAGELCVSGGGVGRGYLNRPGLTCEKFKIINYKIKIKNGSGTLRADLYAFGEGEAHELHELPRTEATFNQKFLRGGPGGAVFSKSAHPGRRRQEKYITLYKSGDWVRLTADGALEYLGRIDQQVKVRGYRIEPGEIETQLVKHDQIKDAVVVVREDSRGDRYLCAYIVSKITSNVDIDINELKKYLSGNMPEYMIPPYFVPLSHIPLTSNGKVDRKALPEPGIKPVGEYIAPETGIEEALLELWSEVLAIEKDKISIDADFFQLGGHSLKATILAAKIHKKLRVKLPLVEIFGTPTIRGLAASVTGAEKVTFIDPENVEERKYYELSFNQKRLFVLQQIIPEASAYNLPGTFILEHEVNEETVKKTLNKVIARHESLRTGFNILNDEPVQYVVKNVELPFTPIDISSMDKSEKQKKRDRVYLDLAATSFELTRIPLFRVVLLKTDAERCEFMFNMHHIITDGWSMEVLKNEFLILYEGFRDGKEVDLHPLKLRYKDFAAWHNKHLEGPVGKKSLEFWRKKLEKGIPALELPVDFPSKRVDTKGAMYRCVIHKNMKEKIKKLADTNNTSLFMVLFSLYLLVLSRFSARKDIACSIIGAGRNHVSLHNIIGFFVNAVIFNIHIDDKENFSDFLHRVHLKVMEIMEYQQYPIEQVCQEMKTRYPDIPVSFNMLNQQDVTRDKEAGLTGPSHHTNAQDVKFDLEPYVTEYADVILMYWAYKKNLFQPSTIEYIAAEYIKLVNYFTTNPNKNLKDYMNKGRKAISRKKPFQAKRSEYTDNNIVREFEARVKDAPHKIAVKSGEENYTYSQLNRCANRIAHRINHQMENITPKAFNQKEPETIGLLLDHGFDMAAGIIGTLKAGKAYVPLSPGFPAKRLSYILADSGVPLLLTREKYEKIARELVLENNISFLDINKSEEIVLDQNPGKKIPGATMAYLLYTSGSTGNPRGVRQNHENVLYFIKNWTKEFSISPPDRITLLSSFCHDASIPDIWGALLNGATLYPFDIKNREDSVELSEFLTKERITLWHSVASLFGYFINTLGDEEIFPGLRYVILGGEAVREHDISRFKTVFPHSVLAAVYGQTESTFNTLWFIHQPGSFARPIIGEELEETEIFVVDEGGKQVDTFEIGEIVVASPYVSPGYWRNEASGKQSFRQNPKTGKLYYTGDLGRLLPDKNIEFIGRKDFQVKIRGFRIEPGEIETHLLKYPHIKEAVVTAKKNKAGDNDLCAYIVSQRDVTSCLSGLRVYLAAQLPDYMIPAFFVQLEKLPLTPGGKIDRKSLPLPDVKSEKAYVAPGNDIEKKIADIWKEILKLPRVGVMDSFFSIGGNSINILKVNTRLKREFNKSIPMVKMFEYPTINSLANYMLQLENSDDGESLDKVEMEKFDMRQGQSLNMLNQTIEIIKSRENNE